MLSATIIDDDISHLMNNLSPLALQIWLYSVSIVCADLSPLWMIYPTLYCRLCCILSNTFFYEWWSISPYLNYDLSHLALQILMHNGIIINEDLYQLKNNLSPLALQIWLYSVSIVCADLCPLINNLYQVALHIMLYSEWKYCFWMVIYPTL